MYPYQPTPLTSLNLNSIVDHAVENMWITSKERDFIVPQNLRLATFYLLPKTHKSLTSPPGRPIISGIETITGPSSKFIDFAIKPITSALPAYLQDTTHMLKKLQEMPPLYVFLVTMDIFTVH